MVLNVILHRHILRSLKANGLVEIQSASPNDPESVRQAMVADAGILVSLDGDLARPRYDLSHLNI